MDVNEKTPIVVGVSATVSRFDGLSLGKVLDKVVFHMCVFLKWGLDEQGLMWA